MDIPADLVDLGRVESPFGIQGWVHIRLFGAQRDSVLLGSRQWWWRPPSGAARLLKVRQCRLHGEGLVAAFDGCEDRDQALGFKGGVVGVSRASFPVQAEDEYYWVDLIGCAVWTPERGALGEIRNVEEFGADPVLRVAGPDGVERLIPFVGAVVVRVDLAAREVIADWGLDY